MYAVSSGFRYSYFELPNPCTSTTSGNGRSAVSLGKVTVVSSGTPSQLSTSPEHA